MRTPEEGDRASRGLRFRRGLRPDGRVARDHLLRPEVAALAPALARLVLDLADWVSNSVREATGSRIDAYVVTVAE